MVEHVHALRYFVPQFDIDAIVLMAGINDLIPFLREPEDFDIGAENPENFSKFLDQSFYARPFVDPTIDRTFPENLALWNVRKNLIQLRASLLATTDQTVVEDVAGVNYIKRRQLLQEAPNIIDELPDMSEVLDQYEANLVAAIETGNRIILITQPFIYSDMISEEAERLLWLGNLGDRNYPTGRYTPSVLAEALDAFNERLLQVCATHQLDCLDLAKDMNGNEAYFYDDVHFNEAGSKYVAEQVSEYLSEVLFES